jgi:16S rRNA (guanine966-N2)-methyltransferase
MRVIGGHHGGRKLRSVPDGVRPTTDRVRESLFAILGDVEGAQVLDVCAGCGSLGLEALSRGASSLVAVEKSGAALKTIRGNVGDLELDDRVQIMRGDARQVLPRLERASQSFDLVFFDPPYDAGLEAEVLGKLVRGSLLVRGARVVVEGAKRHSLPPVPGLERVDERAYGDTILYFLTESSLTGASSES